MFCARRVLRSVLLATILLACGVPSKAQRAFHRDPGDVPPVEARPLRPNPECSILGATPRDPLVGKPSLSHCGVELGEIAADIPRGPAGLSLVVPEIEAVGKKGHSILAARAAVLNILDSENACTEWFRRGDVNPARVFRTLTFTLDDKGVDYVIESTKDNRVEAWFNPYVATAMQNGGESQVVTLNKEGAFFRASANVIRMAQEGGPFQFHGARVLKVGPYLGNTLRAQQTTLFHELGHLLGLLPFDGHDANGQSAANTAEVLRHCQPEIESAAKQPRF